MKFNFDPRAVSIEICVLEEASPAKAAKPAKEAAQISNFSDFSDFSRGSPVASDADQPSPNTAAVELKNISYTDIPAWLRGEDELTALCSDIPVTPDELLQNCIVVPIDLVDLGSGRLTSDKLKLHIVSWLAFGKRSPFPLLTFEHVDQWLSDNSRIKGGQ